MTLSSSSLTRRRTCSATWAVRSARIDTHGLTHGLTRKINKKHCFEHRLPRSEWSTALVHLVGETAVLYYNSYQVRYNCCLCMLILRCCVFQLLQAWFHTVGQSHQLLHFYLIFVCEHDRTWVKARHREQTEAQRPGDFYYLRELGFRGTLRVYGVLALHGAVPVILYGVVAAQSKIGFKNR